MNRNLYDLSNQAWQTGKLSRIVVTQCLPVVAGDSIEMNSQGVVRITPMLRQLTVDARIDMLTCFVPYRHVYGQDWIDLISAGYDEAVTLQTVNAGTGNNWDRFHAHPWMSAGARPLWAIEGYNQIWNRYFRPPKQGIATRDYTYDPTGDDELGYMAATLPAIWNTGHDASGYPTDNTVASVSSFEVTDLAKRVAEWKDSMTKEWQDHYYRDFLGSLWGGSATTDADQKPTILGHTAVHTSGIDVYATAGNIGTVYGRSDASISHGFPRRFFGEHGTIWTLMVVRFPPIHEEESHFLMQNADPDYGAITSDPNIVGREEPYDLNAQDVFKGASSVSLGKVPYGQWLRTQPNLVHQKFDKVEGYPAYRTFEASLQDYVHFDPDKFDCFVGSKQLEHFQAFIQNDTKAWRVTPKAGSSVFAGTTLSA